MLSGSGTFESGTRILTGLGRRSQVLEYSQVQVGWSQVLEYSQVQVGWIQVQAGWSQVLEYFQVQVGWIQIL